MPSLATRRRRAGGDANTSSSGADMLEGGGNRGEQHVDQPDDTQAKIKAFQDQAQFRAHLISFPIFLFGLLALFSQILDLSWLSCFLLPLGLSCILIALSFLIDRCVGPGKGAAFFAEHGVQVIFLFLIASLIGVGIFASKQPGRAAPLKPQ